MFLVFVQGNARLEVALYERQSLCRMFTIKIMIPAVRHQPVTIEARFTTHYLGTYKGIAPLAVTQGLSSKL